jgi:uncharacterized circularly permuted ATP-grasp superfamily protein
MSARRAGQIAVGDVVGHGVVEQGDVLGHLRNMATQVAQAIVLDLHAIEQDLPLSW